MFGCSLASLFGSNLFVSQSVNSVFLLRHDADKNKGCRGGERHCGLDEDIQETVAWPSVIDASTHVNFS